MLLLTESGWAVELVLVEVRLSSSWDLSSAASTVEMCALLEVRESADAVESCGREGSWLWDNGIMCVLCSVCDDTFTECVSGIPSPSRCD